MFPTHSAAGCGIDYVNDVQTQPPRPPRTARPSKRLFREYREAVDWLLGKLQPIQRFCELPTVRRLWSWLALLAAISACFSSPIGSALHLLLLTVYVFAKPLAELGNVALHFVFHRQA